MSNSHKGVIPSEETRKKMSEAKKGEKNSFYGKHHSEETRKKLRKIRLNRVIPFKDTSIEIKLQQEIKKRNIKFEKHKAILGQPDVFVNPNICIFADGDYWHNLPGRKIRDKYVNEELKKQGYVIYRFWEHEINKSIEKCVNKINFLIKKDEKI